MAEEIVGDGSTTFERGQNANLAPDLIPSTNYHAGVNVKANKGVISPRYGIEEHTLVIPDGGIKLVTNFTRTYENIFDNGKFQALVPYSIGSEYYLIIIVSGVIFLVNQETLEVTVVSIQDGSRLNENAPRINYSPAGDYLILYDYPALPVIFDGIVARRSNRGNHEIPVSRLGVNNQTRLMIANGGNEWTASDPVGVAFPNAPLTFNEIETVGGTYYGQIFQLPGNFNNEVITGMFNLPLVDTSTGIGPMLVSSKNAIYSYQTQNPRADWESPGFGTLFIPEFGIPGPLAATPLNSDLYFVGTDGQIRSASMSRDAQTKWSKVPLSREVDNYLKFSDAGLLELASLCYFKNKMFILTNPYRMMVTNTEYEPVLDYAFGGMVVLSFDNMSSLTMGQSDPAWDGLWTGVRPTAMVVNNNRAFLMGKTNGKNRLYEMRPDLTYDLVGPKKTIKKIKTKVYTKEYEFETPFQDKNIRSLEFDLGNLKGEFVLRVSYKTSQAQNYTLWREFRHTAPWNSCCINDICTLLAHDFKEVNLGVPETNPINEVSYTTAQQFRKIQLKFEVEGIAWEIHGFIIQAELVPTNFAKISIFNPEPVRICGECTTDWNIDEENKCL